MMSTLTLTLPASLRAFVECRVARKGYRSPSDYHGSPDPGGPEGAENDEIEGKLLEALLGAPATPVTAET
jgi:hypothetical protein